MQPLLVADFEDNQIVALKEKLPHISITDISKETNEDVSKGEFKNELIQQIRCQNHQLDSLIDSGHEFNILFVKSAQQGTKCTAIVRVSTKIRDVIKSNRNRVFIGINSCRVFERFFIKRCNKCQEFGHYKADCTKKEEVCGFCGGAHASEGCSLKDSKDFSKFSCTNCKKKKLVHSGHSTFWLNCPTYIAAQKRLKSTIPYYERERTGTSLNG